MIHSLSSRTTASGGVPLKLRGYLTLGVIGAGLIVGEPLQRIVVAGLVRLFPSRRIVILTRWQRLLAHFILRTARMLGGARIQPPPAIPGGEGVLVLMNHQSVLDIPLVVAALPVHPRIVTPRALCSQQADNLTHGTAVSIPGGGTNGNSSRGPEPHSGSGSG